MKNETRRAVKLAASDETVTHVVSDAPRLHVIPFQTFDNDKLFDLVITLQVNDGEPPEMMAVHGGPFDRDAVTIKTAEIWASLGKQFVDPTHKDPIWAKIEAATARGRLDDLNFWELYSDHPRFLRGYRPGV